MHMGILQITWTDSKKYINDAITSPSMVAWLIAYPCATAVGAESSAVPSHSPTVIAIAPAACTACCASIVPPIHAEIPGSKTKRPSLVSTIETVDIVFGCLRMRLPNAVRTRVSQNGASATVVVTAG